MKQYFTNGLLICLATAIMGCHSINKQINCTKFKVGKFRYKFKIDTTSYVYLFDRNEHFQTEINTETKETANFNITWIDDCTYELRFLNSTRKRSEINQKMREKNVITTNIITTTNTYYTFSSTSSIIDLNIKDTVWILQKD